MPDAHPSAPVSLDTNALAARLLAAEAIAREAGRLALRFRAAPETLGIALKGPQDFVTAADQAVERLVCARLHAAFPGDAIIGEEYGASGSLDAAPVIWAIDPIDGTANFAAGRPDWCVSLGGVVAGRPEIGVIYQPVTDELYAARRGAGATRNGATIGVRNCLRISDAVVCVEHSARASIDRHVGIVSALLREGAEYRRNGSCAVSLAQIAAGTLDGFVELHVHIWDVLAGLVLIGEAGGRTSDFLAEDGLKNGNALFAAAPGIFDDLVRIGG